MTLKLKPGCWYECDRDDWREVSVMVPGDDGGVPIVQFRLGDDDITIRSYHDDGSEHGFAVIPTTVIGWEYAANSELCKRGWFTPWEVV
jgi:hypothetical protein